MSKPWMKFYPADWQADPAVRSCSLSARGLWIEMLCLMQKAEPVGMLTINGKPLTDRALAVLCGCLERDVRKGLAELETSGVYSRDEDGVIFSRRMVRDEERTARDKANGSKGGNPTLKPGVNPSDNGEVKAQKPETRSQKEVSAQARDLARKIWDGAPSPARRRSNLPAVEKATEAAINDGGEPAAIDRAVRAYFASDDATKDGGRYARAVHRVLQNGGWREWTADAPIPVEEDADSMWSRRLASLNGPERIWIESMWGPAPGRHGCRVPAHLLEAAP